MSATLTWSFAGPQTSTGTTVGAMFTDLKSLIDSKSADSTFPWEVAASNLGSTPYYVNLRPKSGAAGRILFIAWTSAPAGNNAAILDTAPSSTSVHVAYFPAGNVATPSNLTASSGTIMGDDTGAVKVAPMAGWGTSYTTGFQWYVAASAEAIVFCPSSTTTAYFLAAGNLLVDGSDNAYAATMGGGTLPLAAWAIATGSLFPWTNSPPSAGSATTCIRTNYGSSNRIYGLAWAPISWAVQAVGASDILTDSANSKAWFVPAQLLGNTKGEGFVLKLRQIAYGPNTTAPLTAYSTTGPVVAAKQLCPLSAGSGTTGYPWLTDFKL